MSELVSDPNLAWDMARAEKPYRELEHAAKKTGLADAALWLASRADSISDGVRKNDEKLPVRYNTFAEAELAGKGFSDRFIDNILGGTLEVGGVNCYLVKTYLDNVDLTPEDKAVVDSPDRIADLYERTTEVMTRNLKIWTPNNNAALRDRTMKARRDFLGGLRSDLSDTKSAIMDWCNGQGRFPTDRVTYAKSLVVDGKDILDAEVSAAVRPNIKIQHQMTTDFIMGYSDKRVAEKLSKQAPALGRRIYLNPDMEALPDVFEKVLQVANAKGIPLQLKMLQRTIDAASAHKSNSGYMRGDGIVVYVGEKDADVVLDEVLKIVRLEPSVFKGRRVSRIPVAVAEGVAVGDEPTEQSLTAHRADILQEVVEKVRTSGSKGLVARDLFRKTFHDIAVQRGVNPDNIAFNL